MNTSSWFARLEQAQPSYLLLATLAGIVLAAGILYQIGVIGWVLRVLSLVVRAAIRKGFLLWERLLAWASWPLFLAIVLGFLLVGGLAGGPMPGLRLVCGLAPLVMGAIACLAYMFIDLERNEVGRGHKAVHNPLKGQGLAMNLERYGKQARVPLLIAATAALIGGFALFNQGLYETVGRDWYQVADQRREPNYADFLAYALTKILGIVDVLDLVKSHHFMGAAFVRQAAWPASTLLAGFKLFFTLVLLHQISASLRQGKLLAETITDFWSPHEPIHERARNALPIYGTVAIAPLLGSLRFGHIADQGATGPTAVDPGNDRPIDHSCSGSSSARPARARTGDRRCRARPPPCPGSGALVGRPRPRPQRRGASKRGRSAGDPRKPVARARTHQAPPRPGPRREASNGPGGFSGGSSDWRRRRPGTRSSWPWRPWSWPWTTTRPRCGPRPRWRWAGSGRPPRRSPRD